MASSKNGSTPSRPGGAGGTEGAPTVTFTPTDDAEGPAKSSSRTSSKGASTGSSTTANSAGSANGASGSRTGGAKTGGAKNAGTTSAQRTGAQRTGSATSASSANPRGTGSANGANKGASRSPAKATAKAPTRSGGPRRIRLTLSRIDPFSVMKMSFLIAIAVGIATVVAVAVLWNLVEVIGIWDKIDEIGRDLNNDKPLPFMEYFKFSKMISYATIAAVVDIVIITALGTLLAFLYNIVAALLGGLKMTFTDE
ncbi:DUF3566 domain-containing protein [Brachybacterium halotolerans subsp. kimchii]|uniref:DUF3566 domain-containing protein n=1 Tax=Brachybacterium halotolerans TaxID=2795215 RepID=UPI001E3BD14A|nr:DUF3566 domain-containing protein [Brachybacterium halotolerans]UEJ81386.1 DUF3566 domain-containing protein [Brachybacterium halotolerans subsp. kimchii]